MAFIHGKDSQVIHGIYDLSPYLNDASASADVETAETTAFGSSAKSYIVGLRDGTVSASGMFDGVAGAVDEVLTASIGSDTLSPVTIGYNGSTIGNRVTLLQAKTTSYEVSTPIGDVVSVSYSAQADGGLDNGVSLHALGADTTSVNNTAVDNTVSSANGGMAQVHVTVNSRSSTSVIKVQHSADNSTFADLVTFTTVGIGATTSERSLVASGTTVNRYLRSSTTLSAGTGSITYQVSFARR